VREFMNDRDRGNIHRVASVRFERANAALAENDFVVAAGKQVFSGAQEFFEGGGDAAFEQHGLANLAQFTEQIEVLHIACAHLEDVDIRQHQLDLGNLHDFADHQQFETIARFAQEFQTLKAKSLK